MIDFLNGLYNVRHFHAVLKQMIVLSKERSEKLSLLIMDIDSFKAINDTYGHPAGDEI